MNLEDANNYAIETFKISPITILHHSNNEIFKFVQVKAIPLYIWILLKFKKTIKSTDCEIHNGTEYKSVIYAKYLFGHIYIMKE